MCACEALPAGLPARIDFEARSDRDWRRRLQKVKRDDANPDDDTDGGALSEFWERAVHFFTSCSITKQSDRLKALQGIADLVYDAHGKYLGHWYKSQGLWENILVWELPWTVSDGQTPTRPTHDDQLPGKNQDEKERELSFPSWSWASIRDASVDTSTCLPDEEFLDEQFQDDKFQDRPLFLAKPKIHTPSPSPPGMPPPKPRLVMDCPVGRGWMGNKDGHPTLGLDSEAPAFAKIDLFPDLQKKTPQDSEQEFLILAVTREPAPPYYNGEVIYRTTRIGLTESDYQYTGFGLMLSIKTASPFTYERTGVVKFTLDAKSWEGMRQACGGDPDKSWSDLPRKLIEVI